MFSRFKTATFGWLACLLFSVWCGTASAATLLRYNFEGTNVWTGMAPYFSSTSGTVTSAASVTTVGTVNTYGSGSNVTVDNVASNGVKLLVNSSSATGSWTAGVNSGILGLLTTNTITKPGFLTLSFSLWSSKVNPILVRVESYDASNNRTGGLKTLIYPAAPNFYQRFALDLSNMTSDGTGAFMPTNPQIKVYFEIGNALGGEAWPNTSGLELHIDNLNYSTPKYYVKPSSPGSDSNNNGLSDTAPWKTISKAISAAVAGDIIALMGGETDQFVASGTSGLATFAKPGAPDAWIVLKNYPDQRPVLISAGWNTIFIGVGSSGSHYTAKDVPAYIEVRGLTVRGYSSVDANGDRQIASQYKAYVGLADSRSNTNGIGIDGRYCDYFMHDLRIADNIVEYCTAAGIGAGVVDRVTFENNISRYNTWWSIYGGSGFTLGISVATEVNTDTRILIQNNQSYGNEGMMPWRAINAFSDGNGIIVDTNQIGYTSNTFGVPNYTGRTLVQNNLVYNNGGSGIHAFQSAHVDIIHNTAYHNSASPRLLYGQIFAGYSNDIRMMNNILDAPNNPTGNSSFNEPITNNGYNVNSTIYYQNNVFFGEGNNQTLPTNGTNFANNSTGDPLFLSPSVDPTNNNFRLRLTSPALNNGQTIGYRSALDFAGRPRLTTNLTPDRGAYQTQAGDVYAPVFTPQPGNYSSAQAVTLTSDTTGAKIIYTTNGTDPTVDAAGNATNGLVYSSAISVGTATTTLKALAWKINQPTSYISTGSYTFNSALTAIPTPTFDIAPLTDDGTQYVSVICATPGAIVRYTTDGSTPTTTTGTLAPASAIPITAGNIVKAIAYKAGRGNSAVLSGNYVVRPRMGSISEGATTDALGLNKMRFARFQPISNLTVTKIYAKTGAIAGSYSAALYSGTSSGPTTLLKAANANVTGPSAGWQVFNLSGAQAITPKDSSGNVLYYWLALWSNDSAASIYTTTSGGTLCEASSTFGTWPATAPTSTPATNAAYNYSIFATTSYRPVVSAGSNQTLAAGATVATLAGTATDNSTPAVPLNAGVVTTTWSKVSGPGTVTLTNSAALTTTATFSTFGTYVLRLTGQDSVFTPFPPVTSEVTILVPAAAAGAVTATSLGSNASTATLGSTVTFTATVTSGSGTPAGTVTFSDASGVLGTATLNASGVATFSTSSLSVGTHAVTASYGGNSTYASSTTSSTTETINLSDGTTRLLAINAAGAAISGSGFVADAGFTGGSLTSTTATIDTSAVAYPAPQNVYQTERYGNFSYSLGGLTPFAAYLVRLHFSENFYGVGTRTNQTVGQRFFNVTINGTLRLSNFDLWATAGASNKAVIKEFDTAADQSGVITISFASAANNALVDGLEIYSVTPQDAWRVDNFAPAQLDDPTISGPTADYDHDGLNTLMEYALDADPLSNSSADLPQAGVDASGAFTFTFLRARSDLTYIVEGSSDLHTWSTVATNPGSVGAIVTIPDNGVPPSPRFLRLRVTKP